MAASLSRPDPSSPASVAEAGFSTTRRGYSQDEVRAFLISVAAELTRLHERERQLSARLDNVTAEARVVTPELDEETVAALLGEETLRVLQTARESASQIKIRAEESAAQIMREAHDDANRLRQDAEVEAARKRHDAAADAEAEVALAKQQGREMVTEARAYRERVLADLERRTKLARQQIDDLIHGRDRLLQVFERARLVAVDVTSELQSIDAPEEFVNFAPTTGPLPMMVPASQLDTNTPRPPAEELHASDDPADEGLEDPAGETADDTATDTADETAEDTADVAGSEDVSDGSGARAEPATPTQDANVVSLFRGRKIEPVADLVDDADENADAGRDAGGSAEDEDADTGDAGDTGDTGETETSEFRAEVDQLFERLRNETPQAEVDHADGAATDAGERDDATDAAVERTPFAMRDEALVPLILGGARRLKRVLADEQNGALDRLRQAAAVTELGHVVPGENEHAAIYLDALDDELLEAAMAGAMSIGAKDTKTLRTSLRKGGALTRARALVGDDLVTQLRARLERAIADGGGDNEDVTKRVRAVYREWKTQRIDDQLDDAFRFAYGDGLVAGLKPGTQLRWTIDPSESTCPDCEDNSLAGEVGAGDAFPTGHTAAPAHPGCRCLTVPGDQ